MPRYKYVAAALSGEKAVGEYSSPDRDGVVAMLRQNGYYPVSIAIASADVDRATKQKINVKPLAAFCQQMSAMLRAGVPIAKTLEILRDQTDYKPMRLILEDVCGKVQRGTSLYDSFAPYKENLPVIFLNMIEAGEASGTLDTCMERAGAYFGRSAKLNGKLKSAMIYPMVLIVLMFAIVMLLLLFVIPAFKTLFDQNNADLPALTQALVNLSEFVARRWYLVFLGIGLIIFGVRMFMTSKSGRMAFDKFKLHIPAVSKLLKKVYAARYARTLSSMSAAGVPLVQALDVVARSVSNHYIEEHLYKVVDGVNRGEELSLLLERMALLPPMIVYMTRLGEESGTMDTLLNQAADYYDDESDNALQALTAMLEPAMIIIMAVIVLPVIMAIIMPVFSMYSVLG